MAACKSPQKNFLHGDYSDLSRANPTDIAVSKVTGDGLPTEVSLKDLRDELRTQLLDHRYSPLAYEFVDASANSKTGEVRLDLVIRKFDIQKYDISKSMRVAGEFLFRGPGEGGTDKVLASVNSDQIIDLSDQFRQGTALNDAVRIAGRRFIAISLQGLPDRKIDSR